MDITKQVIEESIGMLSVNLRNYANKINEAFLNADDDFKVGLSLVFRPVGSNIEIKSEITFVPEKIKDSTKKLVNGGKQTLIDFKAGALGSSERDFASDGAKVRQRWYQHR